MRVFLILLCSLILSSCISLSNTKEIALTTNTLVQQYDIVKLVVSSKFSKFTNEQQSNIVDLQDQIEILIDQLQNYNIKTTDFRILYLNTMYSYAKAKTILINNSELFNDSENEIIKSFDANIVKLNELFNQPDNLKSAEIVHSIRQIVNMSLVLMASV